MIDLGLNHYTNSLHQRVIGGVLSKSTLLENKSLQIKCFSKWDSYKMAGLVDPALDLTEGLFIFVTHPLVILRFENH